MSNDFQWSWGLSSSPPKYQEARDRNWNTIDRNNDCRTFEPVYEANKKDDWTDTGVFFASAKCKAQELEKGGREIASTFVIKGVEGAAKGRNPAKSAVEGTWKTASKVSNDMPNRFAECEREALEDVRANQDQGCCIL